MICGYNYYLLTANAGVGQVVSSKAESVSFA